MSQTYEIELDVSGLSASDWADLIDSIAASQDAIPTAEDIVLGGKHVSADVEVWRLKAMTEAGAIARVEELVRGTGATVRSARMVE